jgi:FixJ family two-component response regulator
VKKNDPVLKINSQNISNSSYQENIFLHNLRQPLQSIQLIKDLLSAQIKDTVIVDYLGRLDTAINKLSSVIDKEVINNETHDVYGKAIQDVEIGETNLFPPTNWLDNANISSNNFGLIYVVDDDIDLLKNLRNLFERHYFRVKTFSNVTNFLEEIDNESEGYLLIDQKLPGLSGTDIIKLLRKKNIKLNSILMTGFGDVSLAVSAFKAGAVDFIEKPFRGSELLRIISDINKRLKPNEIISENASHYDNDMAMLTPREQQVLKLVLAGYASKNIAADLGTSQRTVENHRASIMRKLKCRSVATLVRRVLRPN